MASSLLLAAGTARGQGTIMVRRPAGEVGVDFDGSWIDFPAVPGTIRRTLQEWLQLRLSGAVRHPRLLSFDVGLRPMRTQTSWTGVPESPGGGIDGFGGSVAVKALTGAPVSLSARGFRSTENNRGRFGVETDLDLTEWGGRLTYRNPYMPLDLDYSSRSRDMTWRPAPQQVIRQDETIRTLRFTARSSKTHAFLERLSFDDRLGERDFTTYRAILDHLLRWGKRSNLSSSLRYYDRVGTAAQERVSWSQLVHLQHTWKLASDYNYQILSQRTGRDVTHGLSGQVSTTYLVLPNLSVGAEWFGQSTQFSAGRQSFYRARPRLSYSRGLPLGARFQGSLSVGYEWQSQEPGEDGFVPVINERHVVEPSGKFTLGEGHADAASVTVTSTDETTVFEAGFDYRIVEAEPFLEILVLPGGRIQVGDTVLVDYRFQIVPAASTNALVTEYDTYIQLGGLRLYHRRSVRDELNGTEPGLLPVLASYEDMKTGIGFTLSTSVGTVDLLGEHRLRQSSGFDFTSYLVRGGFTFAPRRNLRGRIGASTNIRRGGDLPFNMVSAESSLDWRADRSLRLHAGLTAWAWSEDGLRERFIGGGLGAEWQVGLTTLRLRYDRLSWEDGFDRSEDRLLLRAVRSF